MTLKLTRTSAAVTYSFRGEHCAWACCTVNEDTGELSITSDWGNWSFRWNIGHIGSPSLHAFIGRGSLDYLANKLTPGGSRDQFDPDATTAEFRKLVLEARRELRIDKDAAREYWEELGSLAADCGDSCDLYLERFYHTEMARDMSVDEPWGYTQTRSSSEYRALMEIVLPPLCAVCKDEAPKYVRAA